MLKTYEDMYPQSREIFYRRLYMHGTYFACKMSRLYLQSYIFARFWHITFILGKFTNFKALFQVVSMDQKLKKKPWKVCTVGMFATVYANTLAKPDMFGTDKYTALKASLNP